MKILPAIDLLEGKCVRLLKGDYNKAEVFHENPVQMALELENAGFRYLHLVDLDGARNSGDNKEVLGKIAEKTSLKIDFGGGLRKIKDITAAINSGAHKVNIGSMAVKNQPEFEKCLSKYGEKIVWNADLKDGKLAVNGWQDTVENNFPELIMKFFNQGLKYILTTDISKDGALQGPNVSLYKELIQEFPQINWIASGGVTAIGDVQQLKEEGLYGAVIGKAMYKGLITFDELIAIQNAY